jgi:hypothetical protein
MLSAETLCRKMPRTEFEAWSLAGFQGGNVMMTMATRDLHVVMRP